MSRSFSVPPPVDPGGTVRIIAPSSGGAASARSVLALGVDRLETRFGVAVEVHPTARQSSAFLAVNPRSWAAAIHEAFRAPAVEAVVATIGGDDQIRVLPYLDTAVLRRNPTRFFGMSDNTVMALALYDAGVPAYYGGQLMNQVATPGGFPSFTEEYLRRALFEPALGELRPSDWWTDDVISWSHPDYAETEPEREPAPGWSWASGETGVVTDPGALPRVEPVVGRLWGGCVEVLSWLLMADKHIPEPDAVAGNVLLLETAEDRPDADTVGWILRSMGERGLVGAFDSVLVGRPQTRNRRTDPGPEARAQYRTDQRSAILEELAVYNPTAPVVFDIDVGHTNPTAPLPIGGTTVVDPGQATIRFPGPDNGG